MPYLSLAQPPLSVTLSHNIAAFVLGLQFEYEGEHAAFGLLNLLTSLKTVFSNFIHLPVNDKITLFFVAQ
jgi:hypothetical protein